MPSNYMIGDNGVLIDYGAGAQSDYQQGGDWSGGGRDIPDIQQQEPGDDWQGGGSTGGGTVPWGPSEGQAEDRQETQHWISDGGFYTDPTVQGNNPYAVASSMGSINHSINSKYEDAFDKEAEANLSQNQYDTRYVGDDGTVFDMETGMPAEDVSQYYETDGNQLIDHWQGLDDEGRRKGFTSRDARSGWMDRDAFQWYIDQGYVSDTDGATQWLKENPDTTVIAKSDMQGKFGFTPYERNFGDKLFDTANAANNGWQAFLGDIGQLRSSQGYDAIVKGQRRHVDDKLINELREKWSEANSKPNWVLSTGEEVPYEALAGKNVVKGIIDENGGYHVFLDDGNEFFLGYDPNISTKSISSIKDDKGRTWTRDDILDNFTDLGLLDAAVEYDVEPGQEYNYLNKLVTSGRAGKAADYGNLNMSKPQSAMNDGDIFKNITGGNFFPQLTDLILGSAPYFSPYTAIPTGLGNAWSAAQGADTMGKSSNHLATVGNSAFAAPAMGAATAGEMFLGGAAGRGFKNPGEGRGFFEWLGDNTVGKVAPRAMGTVTHTIPGRIARDAVDEGLEEIATSPLYELSQQGPAGFYANDEINKRGFKTGEKDIAHTSMADRWRNWSDTLIDDFLGGAMIGGPMATAQELGKRDGIIRSSNDKNWFKARNEGIEMEEADDWLKQRRRNNNG